MGLRHTFDARRRRAGDRGATLIESAIITPILMLFVFGIFEYGFAFRDYLTVSNATRDAAREASVAGDTGTADYRVLRTIRRAAAALPDGALDAIVVYKATGPDDPVPDNCKTGSVTNQCNYYTPSSMNLDTTAFGCQSTSNSPPDPIDSPDRFWCPFDREVSVGSGLDYVGIYIRSTHDFITGMFGAAITFEDELVLKVEPQSQ